VGAVAARRDRGRLAGVCRRALANGRHRRSDRRYRLRVVRPGRAGTQPTPGDVLTGDQKVRRRFFNDGLS
jgi:hypothetical protein